MSFAPWIKIEQTLPDKPEVVRMAAALDVDQDSITGKLLRIWIWVDANFIATEKLPVTATFIDRITACPGFANAMRAVGWLAGDDGALYIPGFERHNGETAKERASHARRMDKHRRRKDLDVITGATPTATPGITENVTPTVTFSSPSPLPRERGRDRIEDLSPLPPQGGASAGAPSDFSGPQPTQPDDTGTRQPVAPQQAVQPQQIVPTQQAVPTHHPVPLQAHPSHHSVRPSAHAPAHWHPDDQFLIDHIKSLRRRWQASPLLSAREARIFRKNRAIVTLFTQDDWHTLARFMTTRLPEGSAFFQPEMLEKFLENPGAVLGHARDWLTKQRPKNPATPPTTRQPTTEPPVTPEEMKRILSMRG